MDHDLTPEECRVLGCLLEKAAATPDQYPLSINALLQACNQKSNREPVTDLAEADVRAAVTDLVRRGLVRQASSYGGRTNRFEHRLGRGPGSALDASPQGLAVLCLLLLRGPQTSGELRARSRRLAAFADVAGVEATLEELAGARDEPLVERLAREPGKRESRWRHRLAADHDAPAATTAPATADQAGGSAAVSGGDDLEARVAELERIVAELQSRRGGDPGR